MPFSDGEPQVEARRVCRQTVSCVSRSGFRSIANACSPPDTRFGGINKSPTLGIVEECSGLSPNEPGLPEDLPVEFRQLLSLYYRDQKVADGTTFGYFCGAN